jgi:hypothetical protein
VLISDHINLTADSPLEGATFIDLTDLYSRGCATRPHGRPDARRGRVLPVPRPALRDPAEVQMAKTIGGHIVGMSTALEAIAARQAGMEVLGFSLITNLAAGIQKTPLSHAEVIEAGRPPSPSSRPAGPRDRRAVSGRRRRCSRGARLAAQDPDEETRDELAGSSRAPAGDEAARRPRRPLRHAPRVRHRGPARRLGAGSNRMNRVLVSQAAAGFAAYLREGGAGHADGRHRLRRPPNSDVFARDSAEIFAGAGLRAVLLPRLLPTRCSPSPCATSAPRRRHGDGRTTRRTTTATRCTSAADQGRRSSPRRRRDRRAHRAGRRRRPARTCPRAPTRSPTRIVAYVAATAPSPGPRGAAGMNWVYTAMHGVGYETLSRSSARRLPAPSSSSEQRARTAFPTVAFPNPEEPGAMDLAFATARAPEPSS